MLSKGVQKWEIVQTFHLSFVIASPGQPTQRACLRAPAVAPPGASAQQPLPLAQPAVLSPAWHGAPGQKEQGSGDRTVRGALSPAWSLLH
eukprot:637568-Pelagomonas_calceolata.AAC.1